MPFSLLKRLFSSSPKQPDYKLLVWRDHPAKWKGLVKHLSNASKENYSILLLAWFPDTLKKLEYLLAEMQVPFSNNIGAEGIVLALADNFLSATATVTASTTECIITEHYPLSAPEAAVLQKLSAQAPNAQAMVYACMDEQIYVAFNGKRIKEMMMKLGFKEDETVEHSMIRNSIIKAQERIAEKLVSEQKCKNDEEWFARNFRL